ncbi:helix-turn-helix domain-containing protein [Citrobacter freundii]|nr:helix-turn-helix domain-containing protein [Citrobacter freundii]HBU6166318.1 hypothetical protein [Citrobacter freundii]HBV8018507.1 hypothetical protein [Citrobacter freundii]
MKTCSRCHQQKEERDFQIRRASNDGLTAACRSCLAEYDRARAGLPHRVSARREYQSSDHGREHGGRGITVCERWLLFENFLCDMGSRPEGKTLDRIDSNKGYFKENCQWQTMQEQQRNRRNNRIIKTPDGEMCVSEAAIHYGINKSTLLTRINNGLSEFDSCTTPVKSRGDRHE